MYLVVTLEIKVRVSVRTAGAEYSAGQPVRGTKGSERLLLIVCFYYLPCELTIIVGFSYPKR